MDAVRLGLGGLVAVATGIGCGGNRSSDDGDGGASLGPTAGAGETSAAATSGADGGTAATATATATSSADSDTAAPPPVFDVGSPDGESATDGEMGCRNIDFLFVIDNSGSMAQQQTQLLASFPGFITAIQNTLVDVDSYHVGVVTSDNYTYNEPGCNMLGALVTQTQTGACTPFALGNRYVTEQDDLATAFQCIAQVGTSGSGIEQPVSALAASVQSPLTDVGGCNEGFWRADAIAVIVVVTDDPPYAGTIDDADPLVDVTPWHDAVVNLKGGNEQAVVVLGFVPWGDLSCVCPWCCPGTGCNAPSPNLIGFVQSFGAQGVLASVCEPDYSPTFTSTVETIDATCQGFTPPG